MMSFEKQLSRIGLTENQARVYLASLELGPSAVLRIAERARIKRPTAYVAIEELMKFGLMSSFTKGKKRYFSGESPEKLFDLVRSEKEELTRKEREVESSLPELLSLFTVARVKPQVRFFEGREGIVAIQKDILRSPVRETHEFTPIDEAYKLFPPSPKDHRHKLMKKFKAMHIIYTSKKGAILPLRQGKIRSRFVPPQKFPFSTEITVYGEKTAFTSLGQSIIGVIIESKEIADTMRTLFALVWEAAGKYNKTKV